MNKFTVNGKEYTAKPFDFGLLCDLEDMGITLEEMGKKNLSMVRAYFILCANKGKEYATKELNEQFVKHGEFGDITNAINKEMTESDFFRAVIKAAETEAAESPTEESEKE